MPSEATPERAAFVKEEFRSLVWKSSGVQTQYGKVAQDTKDEPIPTYFNNLADAQVMLNERGAILGAHARRFRAVIHAILTETDLGFATELPAVSFIDDELMADMTAVVLAIESVDFDAGQTTLLLWGTVGSPPTPD